MSNSMPRHRQMETLVLLTSIGPALLISNVLSADVPHLTDAFGRNSTLTTQACDPRDYQMLSCLRVFKQPSLLASAFIFHSQNVVRICTSKDSFFPRVTFFTFLFTEGVYLPST